jgi:hypothetical protein
MNKKTLTKMKKEGFKKVTIILPSIGKLFFKKEDINYLMIDGVYYENDDLELFIEGYSNHGHVYFKSSDFNINDIKLLVEF